MQTITKPFLFSFNKDNSIFSIIISPLYTKQ